jgi:hypothetical protein
VTTNPKTIGRCGGCDSAILEGVEHTCPAKRLAERAYKTNLHWFTHFLRAGFSPEEAARLAGAEEIEA